MATDYNSGHVAEQYLKVKAQPWRARLETYSFMKLIGDVDGKTVVDIACGEGYFTRRLRQAGAARIVGCDISDRMIGLAREREASEALGIEYRVEDARSILPQQDFDLAVAAWLLVYAHDRAELAQMCQGLARRLRPGGRVVTMTTNPGLSYFRPLPDYRKYGGFEVQLTDRVFDIAALIRLTFHLDDSSLEIENYYLPGSAYESALRDAGFRDVKLHRLEVEPDGPAGEDGAYWAELLDHPVGILIDCVKE